MGALAVVALSVLAGGLASASPQAPPPKSPSLESPDAEGTASVQIAATREDAPDPTIVRADDGWYVFTTASAGGEVPVWRSTDLATWELLGNALAEMGSWALPGRTWAPAVAKVGARWVLFYSAATPSGQQCIGRAEASGAAGPYVDRRAGPLVCGIDGGNGAIDPSPLVTPDGRLFIHWKNSGISTRQIYGMELSPETLEPVAAPVFMLNAGAAWEAGGVENPTMMLVKGRWWLFYSANWWTGNRYAIGYAACWGPTGPCWKVTSGGPWYASSGFVGGPGGASFAALDGDRYVMAHHAWHRQRPGYSSGGRRELHLTTVEFSVERPTMLGSTLTGPRYVAAVRSGSGVIAVADDGRLRSYRGARAGVDIGRVSSAGIVGVAAVADGSGTWVLAGDGSVTATGSASVLTGPAVVDAVGIAATPNGSGYWVTSRTGEIAGYGGAPHLGAPLGLPLKSPIVGMAATPSGRGYWLVASDGGIFAYGDARFFGSTGAIALRSPIVGMATTPSGGGYWLVAADGGIFAFGDAPFVGSAGGWLARPSVRAMVGAPDGSGYWLITDEGEVEGFGSA